jgi:hypothetical protein
VAGRSPKPPGCVAGWIFGRSGRCGSRPSRIRRHPNTWESVQRVRHCAPGQSSFVAGSHGECVVRPCGRCTVQLVDRYGREVQPLGPQMVGAAQIGSR